MKKKLIAGMTSAALIASLAVPAFAASNFTDIDGSYAKAAIEELVAKGIINGVDATHFNPDGSLTRAQFAKIVAGALGLDTSATVSSFSDVSGWAVGYVEAAKKAGLIDGVGNGQYDPNGIVNREQAAKILVNALKTKMDLDMTADLSFPDKDQVSDWAKSFVAVAAKYGLIKGNDDGTFNPKGNATRAQAAVLAQRLLTEIETAAYAITPATANLAVGQSQQFTVAGAKNVVWSVSGNGVIDQNGNFVGSAAGSATITAVADGKTLTQAVTVYGAASAVKLSADATVVANGKSTTVVTATVVDANGNPVNNFNGTLAVSKYTDNGASSFVDSNGAATTTVPTLTVSNGQASFTVIASSVFGRTDTYQVTGSFKNADGSTTNLTSAKVNVASVAQTATSIKVTPALTSLSNNGVNGTNVTAQVLDQTGNPMLSGTYQLTFAVSGAGTFAAGSTTNYVTAANYNATDAAVETSTTIYSVQGQTGAINVSVTGNGLTSGSATVNAVTVGKTTQIALSSSNNSAAVDATSLVPVTITLKDAAGNVTPAQAAVTVNLDEVTTAGALEFFADKAAATSAITNVVFNVNDSSKTVYVRPMTNADVRTAGNYTVVAKDNANVLTQATQAVSFTAGSAVVANLAFTQTNPQTLAVANPTATVSVQLKDGFGNKVAKSGVYVQFQAVATTGVTNKGTAKLNGQDTSTTPIVVQTDANGVASVTLSALGYVDDSYTVQAEQLASSSTITFDGSAKTSQAYKVGNYQASTVSASFRDTQTVVGSKAVTVVTAGSTVYGTVTVKDANGIVISGDKIQIDTDANTVIAAANGSTVTGGVNADGTTATYYLTGGSDFALTGGKAGTTSLKFTDVSNANATGSASINVVAGVASKIIALTPNGDQKAYTTTTAGVYGPFTLQVTDSQGNVVNAAGDLNILSTDVASIAGGGTGVRLTQTGSDVQTVKIAAGTSSVQVYIEEAANATVTPTTAGKAVSSLVPVATISGVTNGQITNAASVTPTATGGATYAVSLTNNGTAVAGYTLGTAITAEGSYVLSVTPTDAAGNTGSATVVNFTIDRIAPTATLPATTGATNNATTLVATFDSNLYINGVAVANGADVAASFTAAGAVTITTAIYDATAKTVTFTLAGAVDTNTITHNTGATALTDAAGNAYAAKVYTYSTAGTIWTSN